MRKSLVLTIIFVFACGVTLSSIMASAQEDYNIPAWIKNNAAWWSQGQIDDASFVNGIKYMIENGIMEITQSNNQAANDDLYKENQRLNSLLDEYQDANEGFAESEKDLYAEIDSLKKQLSNASQGTSADATTIELYAQTNPFIRSIIDGKINFYVEPLPYYAADGVEESVKTLTDWMDSTPMWNQVYDENSADLFIGWIRDYGHKALGITYSKNTIEVGLGTQNCTGDWAPFNESTVYHVLWHEIGHSMGYGHSDDPNNVMYYSFPRQFYPDTDDSDFLADGMWTAYPICGSGLYSYVVEVVEGDEYTGFNVDVLPPEQDPQKFVDEGGSHYPDCSPDGPWITMAKECNVDGDGVNNFSWLVILNDQDSGTPGEGIRINVKIADMNPSWQPDLEWDPEVFQYDDEFLDYVSNFVK